MNRHELADSIESLRDAELLRYAKEYVRLSVAESDNPRSDIHSMVDLIYAECVRRGKEWLYDKAREVVYREITDLYAANTDDRQARGPSQHSLRSEPADDESSRLSPEVY